MQPLHEVMRHLKNPLGSPGAVSKPWNRRDWLAASAAAAMTAGSGSAANANAQIHAQLQTQQLPQTRGQNTPSTSVRVLAASDLKFALADITAQYQQQTGVSVQSSLGSSGNFARQIAQGLPGDIFMSADASFVAQLVKTGHTLGTGVLYAIGSIAWIFSNLQPRPVQEALNRVWGISMMSATPPPGAWQNAQRALAQSLVANTPKLAIANPDHAPYGRAASEALQALGLWEAAKPRLVLGENIAQATQFVTTGAAQAGITATSMLLPLQIPNFTYSPFAAPSASAPVLPSLQYVHLSSDLHAPLHQHMVLLKNASPAAQAFFGYLQSAAARAVLQRYGFGVGTVLGG